MFTNNENQLTHQEPIRMCVWFFPFFFSSKFYFIAWIELVTFIFLNSNSTLDPRSINVYSWWKKSSSKRWLQKKNFINFWLGFESVDKLPKINSRALGNACASFGKEKKQKCLPVCVAFVQNQIIQMEIFMSLQTNAHFLLIFCFIS